MTESVLIAQLSTRWASLEHKLESNYGLPFRTLLTLG
jgi:hypothetical protein